MESFHSRWNAVEMLCSHPGRVWHFQFGVGGGLDGDDRLVSESADGADVLIGHIA